MGFVRVISREKWKLLGPKGRSEELEKFAFSCGGSGEIKLIRESLLSYIKRRVSKWVL